LGGSEPSGNPPEVAEVYEGTANGSKSVSFLQIHPQQGFNAAETAGFGSLESLP
jgi:hypothetical protein